MNDGQQIMNNLLSLEFWLNFKPGALAPTNQKIFIAFVVSLIILTITFGFIQIRNKKNLYARFWRSLYYFCLTNAIIGLVLLFFTYELVPFLSARFLFLLWGAGIIVWLVFIVRILIKIPGRKKELEKKKEFKKYVP